MSWPSTFLLAMVKMLLPWSLVLTASAWEERGAVGAEHQLPSDPLLPHLLLPVTQRIQKPPFPTQRGEGLYSTGLRESGRQAQSSIRKRSRPAKVSSPPPAGLKGLGCPCPGFARPAWHRRRRGTREPGPSSCPRLPASTGPARGMAGMGWSETRLHDPVQRLRSETGARVGTGTAPGSRDIPTGQSQPRGCHIFTTSQRQPEQQLLPGDTGWAQGEGAPISP